jgi:lysophospholipase L1-like esterase
MATAALAGPADRTMGARQPLHRAAAGLEFLAERQHLEGFTGTALDVKSRGMPRLAAVVAAGLTLPAAAGTGRLALLGDSYSSGEGAGPYDSGTDTSTDACHRSSNSWERIFAAMTSPYSGNFDHVACSGAVLNNYNNPNQGNNEPPQNSILSPSDGLVLLSLSGNDINFRDVAVSCITRQGCQSKYVVNGFDSELQTILSKEAQLTGILQDIRTRAPNADVYISTYPNIVSTDSRLFCTQDGNLPQSDRIWLAGVTRELDNMVIRAANAAGVNVIDAYGAFAGHELCTSDVWANPLGSTSNPSEWFHPNAKGYAAWANLVINTVRVNFGGVDLNGYCRARGYDGVSLDGSTAYDWHCDIGSTRYSIDMVDACGWQYGATGPWNPSYRDFNDPYSWECWRGNGAPQLLAPPPGEDPVAVDYNNQFHVFARGTITGNLLHAWWDGSWHFENLGGVITGAPSVTVYGSQLKVTADGSDGKTVYTDTYNNGWSGWQQLACCGAGVATVVFNGQFHVFARDTGNGHLIHAWCGRCDGSDWSFDDLGGIITGTPSVTVYGSQLKVVAVGSDGTTVWQDTWNNVWSGWQSIAGPANGATGSVFNGQFHIVAHATDTGHVVHAWCATCNGSDWNFQDLSQPLPSGG